MSRPETIAPRNSDYHTEISWTLSPDGGRGFWGAADVIEGAATWIDTPRRHGLLFFPRQGHGRVGYDSGAVTHERPESWWCAYDPKDLAAVARGKREPWDRRPATADIDYPGGGPR